MAQLTIEDLSAGKVKLSLAERSAFVSFKSPFNAKNLEDLRRYLEEAPSFSLGGDAARIERIKGSLQGWGQSLYKQLFEQPGSINFLPDIDDSFPAGLLFRPSARP